MMGAVTSNLSIPLTKVWSTNWILSSKRETIGAAVVTARDTQSSAAFKAQLKTRFLPEIKENFKINIVKQKYQKINK